MKTILFSNSLAERCPDVLALWDYEKNRDVCPNRVSHNTKTRVWWKCDRGHSWQAPVNGIAYNGTRCPYCAGYKAIPGETDIATLFPEIAAEWDHEKNGTLDPSCVTAASHTPIWWKCARGHSYQSAPFSRTGQYKSGCPYCAGRKVLQGFNDLETLKPMLASEWYQPLNGELKPSDVTLGSNKRVWWCCSDNHVWEAYVYARTKFNGTGCPVCAGVVKTRKIKYFMRNEALSYEAH